MCFFFMCWQITEFGYYADMIATVCCSLPLIDIASAEQTAVSHAVLLKLIRFDDQQNIEEAERYLLATALNTHPTEFTLKHLLVCLSLARSLSLSLCASVFRTNV